MTRQNQDECDSDGESLSSLESGGLTLLSVNSFQSSVTKEKKPSTDPGKQETLAMPHVFASSCAIGSAASEREVEIAIYPEPEKDGSKQRKFKRRVGIAALAVLGLIVMLSTILGIILSNQNDNPRNVVISQAGDYMVNDSKPGSGANSASYGYVYDILVDFSEESLLLNERSPQGLAFTKLVQEEEARKEKSKYLADSGIASIEELKEGFEESTTPMRIIQRFALMNLFLYTQPDQWHFSEGWNDFIGNECSWYGIDYCEQFEVRRIDLSSNNLVGTIPEEICLLGDYLEELSLGHNVFSGQIPSCLSNFKRLEVIILKDNNLSGWLPAGLMHILSLKIVDFSQNTLSGTLDVLFEENRPVATGLQIFDVSSNMLTGTIPDEFVEMSSLSKFTTDMTNFNWMTSINLP